MSCDLCDLCHRLGMYLGYSEKNNRSIKSCDDGDHTAKLIDLNPDIIYQDLGQRICSVCNDEKKEIIIWKTDNSGNILICYTCLRKLADTELNFSIFGNKISGFCVKCNKYRHDTTENILFDKF